MTAAQRAKLDYEHSHPSIKQINLQLPIEAHNVAVLRHQGPNKGRSLMATPTLNHNPFTHA